MKACVDAINRLGLQKGGGGWNFDGSWYWTKGCNAYDNSNMSIQLDNNDKLFNYANMAYYGTGGSGDEVKVSLEAPKYRPIGYDCSTGKSCNFI